MIPKRVWLAVLVSFLCHGLFVLSARYRFSYDAYTHMLFANHYAEGWFSLWEPRWYTGFTVVSYPPLTHQLVALFIPILGFDKAFALVLWVVTSVYPLGVYAFSRIFASRTASAYAALASALLLPIYVTAYVFGQFPFLTSTLFSLFGAASLNRYLRQGGIHNLLLTVSLYATMMASHHATLIVQPFWAFAVILNYVLASPHQTIQWRRLILRLLLVGFLAIIFGLFVIWPFWQWGTYQTMQTPIDHLSRHNFFTDPLAFAIFFFPLYGPLAALIPFLFRKWHPRFIGLLVSFTLLFLLGLGGTTPLPRLFFGTNWEWLTYDRFAFWAGLTLTPFFGILFIRLKYGRFLSRPQPAPPRKNSISSVVFSIFALTALGTWFQPIVFHTQPAPLNMWPIVEFLDQDGRSQWRYLTFGFGNQFAYLNLLTTATTIDGSYHTVRTLPELRESGIAEVDTAYWALKGIPAIGPILEKSGDHGVRWGFVNRAGFIPELEKNGWVYRTTLSNEVQVWENPDAVLPKPSPPPETNPLTAFSWGVLPILSFVITMLLGGLRVFPMQFERIVRTGYSLIVGLVPISICFWYYSTIAQFPHPRVYFTYTNVLIFFTDVLMFSAVLLWAFTKSAQRPISQNGNKYASIIVRLFFFITLLTSLSVLWSRDWRVSLFVSLHFWLLFLFVLSLQDWHVSLWKIAVIGLCAALVIEVATGFAGFAMQSTGFLDVFHMEWPGILDPSMRGASVVQLADGVRVLRAYGTLPHPNLLGGFALLTLLGTSSLFLSGNKPNYLALTLHIFGVILIGISFSRSAWLGFLVFIAVLSLKAKAFNNRKHLWLLIATSLLTMFMALYFMRDLVFTRIGNSSVATENLSTFGRVWLTEQALNMLFEHPWTGVGIGSFIIELANYAVEGAIIEPVHNLFLLAGSELGIVGLILVVALFVFIVLEIFKAKSPQAILASATLAGLGIISLFDHYIWTLAPGRAMLGLTLGLWLGRISDES